MEQRSGGTSRPGGQRRTSRWHNHFQHYLPVLVGVAVFAVVVTVTPTVSLSVAVPNTNTGATSILTYPSGDAPNDHGVSSGGVTCGNGARQVAWSDYAPVCQPAYTGSNNGGSTAPGVTGSTITLSYRYAATPAEVALAETLAPGAIGTQTQAVQVTDDYIKIFNRAYDLYGRHVVLKVFTGEGDLLLELGGQDEPQAEADAATAKSVGAFADVSGTFNDTLYDNALAQEGIISVGGLYQSTATMDQTSPFEYSPGPDCEQAASSLAYILGSFMAHKPATLAGSSTLRSKPRVFGLLVPDSATYNMCATTAVNLLSDKYHQKMAGVIHYGITSLAGTTEADNAIAQFKSEGVTTIMCACDPIYPIFFTAAANAQDYHPEWLSMGFSDSFNRLVSQNQWSHALSTEIAPPPEIQQEAYKVFRMVDQGSIPPLYDQTYEALVLLFGALQAAGPDLTPQHFREAFDALPASLPGGQYGPFATGPGSVSAAKDFQILQWDPTKPSPVDGLPGTWVPCNDGKVYTYRQTATAPTVSENLQCPISF